MTTEFILPDIGEGIVECELLEWLVNEGDNIEEDQPVAEVMTDKATVQIPAMHAGLVTRLYYQPGDIAKVHQPLFTMEVAKDNATATASETPQPVKPLSNKTPAQPTTETEDFILPDIGEGIVECEIVKWHVSLGDDVSEDQPVVEVMTDKAVVEIPAKHNGVVGQLYYKEGDIARVHQPLFSLIREHNSTPQPQGHSNSTEVKTVDNNSQAAKTATQWDKGEFDPPKKIVGKVLASPAVRRLAREQNISLSDITGSGKKGRILKQDLQALAGQLKIRVNEAVDSVQRAATTDKNKTVPLRGIQAAMAKQMVESVSTIPHFTVTDELDMSALIALRNELKPQFAKQGIKLSFMPFFMKAMSLALQEFPIINSQLNDEATALTYLDDHNIGFAVDSKIGLMVPNIKRVQELSIKQIAQQLQELLDKAREGKLDAASLKGGTISISNVGVIGGISATPVINKPEAAIVALGKMQTLPRFNRNEEVVARQVLTVSWSGDHRIIDGATMVKFNNCWMDYLTQPLTMLAKLR